MESCEYQERNNIMQEKKKKIHELSREVGLLRDKTHDFTVNNAKLQQTINNQ